MNEVRRPIDRLKEALHALAAHFDDETNPFRHHCGGLADVVGQSEGRERIVEIRIVPKADSPGLGQGLIGRKHVIHRQVSVQDVHGRTGRDRAAGLIVAARCVGLVLGIARFAAPGRILRPQIAVAGREMRDLELDPCAVRTHHAHRLVGPLQALRAVDPDRDRSAWVKAAFVAHA